MKLQIVAQAAALEPRGPHPHIPVSPKTKQGIPLLRPERVLLLERLVRDELTLHRHLAVGRRAASARMSATRRALAGALPTAAPVVPVLEQEIA
jgi:hypothetical protein